MVYQVYINLKQQALDEAWDARQGSGGEKTCYRGGSSQLGIRVSCPRTSPASYKLGPSLNLCLSFSVYKMGMTIPTQVPATLPDDPQHSSLRALT